MNKYIRDKVHRKRYFLSENAPICKGRLKGDFGYLAKSHSAKKVLNGTYAFPDNMDEDKKEICEEVARIRQIIPKDSASFLIAKETWQNKWSKSKEDTSSSYLGIHFGHYIAGAESDLISQFHSMKTSIALKEVIALSRWSNGLSVMLKKMFVVRLVSKLQAILLMEADSSSANKIVYGNWMLENVRK